LPDPKSKKIYLSPKIKRAWIIKWSSMRSNTEDNKVIGILNSRKTTQYVQDLVRQLYISVKYTPLDMINMRKNPPPILFADSTNGIRWHYRFSCGGDDPFLEARIVQNLRLVQGKNGEEKLEWDELTRPTIHF